MHFGVPTKHRGAVPMATCPICSPDHPKFYEGALAWFPEDGTLRAIGCDCARAHFGDARFEAALERERAKRAEASAEQFLFDTLPTLPVIIEKGKGIEAAGKEADGVRRELVAILSKRQCADLRRAAASGVLSISEARKVAAVDRGGEDRDRWQTFEVARFVVGGMGFLAETPSIEARARAAVSILGLFPTDEEGILGLILENTGQLASLHARLREALANLEEAGGAVDESRAFLAARNLSALSQWSNDRRASAGFALDYDARHPERFSIGVTARFVKPVPIHEMLRTVA